MAFGCDVWVGVWVQTKISAFPCLLFIFVGSLVTVNFSNLDFHCQKHQNNLCFFRNLERNPLRSKPAAGPKASQRVLWPPWAFWQNGGKTPRSGANFDDRLYSSRQRIGAKVMWWTSVLPRPTSSTSGLGPGGLGPQSRGTPANKEFLFKKGIPNNPNHPAFQTTKANH